MVVEREEKNKEKKKEKIKEKAQEEGEVGRGEGIRKKTNYVSAHWKDARARDSEKFCSFFFFYYNGETVAKRRYCRLRVLRMFTSLIADDKTTHTTPRITSVRKNSIVVRFSWPIIIYCTSTQRTFFSQTES